MKALAKVTELMSSSRRLLSTSASLHQLSHRRYGKGTWLAQDCQWNFKCQGLGFGFVLGSHQKCLSFEVTGSDGCLQEIILGAGCCLLRHNSSILNPSTRNYNCLSEIMHMPAYCSSSLPFSVCATPLLCTHVCVYTPIMSGGHNLAED